VLLLEPPQPATASATIATAISSARIRLVICTSSWSTSRTLYAHRARPVRALRLVLGGSSPSVVQPSPRVAILVYQPQQ
jgi:acyl-CoA reductase-like NAD-dependent aldehyde dehydrogenase